MSLDQLFLEKNFDFIIKNCQETLAPSSSSISVREKVETTIFLLLAKTFSSSNESNVDFSLLKNQLLPIYEKFYPTKEIYNNDNDSEEEEILLTMPRSSFFRLLSKLLMIFLNYLETLQKMQNANESPVVSVTAACLLALPLFDSYEVFAEARELSKREKVLEVILAKLTTIAKESFQKFTPELAEFLSSGIAKQELLSMLKKNNVTSEDQQVNHSVFFDSKSGFSFKTNRNITAGEVVFVDRFEDFVATEKNKNNANNKNSLPSSFQFLLHEMRRFRGSFPHFFNALCDLTEEDEDESNNNKNNELTEQEKLHQKQQLNEKKLAQKTLIEKFESLARFRDQVSEKSPNADLPFPGIISLLENEKVFRGGGDFLKSSNNAIQLRLEALAQFLFCRCSVPFVTLDSNLMDLEGDGLQFSNDSVPEPRKFIEEIIQQQQQQQQMKAFLDETNHFLSDFHQPRLLFPLISWIPHSCSPNCFSLCVPSTKNADEDQQHHDPINVDYDDLKNQNYHCFVIALKDIPKNSPISISRLGHFAPPSVRGSFCGGVAPNRSKVVQIAVAKKEEHENEVPAGKKSEPPTIFLACDFCNGPLGDILEVIVCPKCKIGCVPVSIPPSAREKHGKYAKCCGFCTSLLPMTKLHKDVVDHSEMAVGFALSGPKTAFKSVRVLSAILDGLPLVTGNHHLRLRLSLEIIAAAISHEGGIATEEDITKAKSACVILQDTVEKIVPVISPSRAALWMASVRVFGLSARLKYHEMKKTNGSIPPFNLSFIREQCSKDFSEIRDRVSYAFETFSVIYSSIQKYQENNNKKNNNNDLSSNEIVERFVKSFKSDLDSCGVCSFENVVELMRH